MARQRQRGVLPPVHVGVQGVNQSATATGIPPHWATADVWTLDPSVFRFTEPQEKVAASGGSWTPGQPDPATWRNGPRYSSARKHQRTLYVIFVWLAAITMLTVVPFLMFYKSFILAAFVAFVCWQVIAFSEDGVSTIFTNTVKFALNRALTAPQGWLMVRWLEIAFRMVRDWSPLIIHYIRLRPPHQHEESVQFLLECIRDAAAYVHQFMHAGGRDGWVAEKRYEQLLSLAITMTEFNRETEAPGLRKRWNGWMWTVRKCARLIAVISILLGVLNIMFGFMGR